MPRGSDRSGPEELRRNVAERRQRTREAIGQTSSVPLALFGPCDPMVEAQLLDNATQLLRYMGVHEMTPPKPGEQPSDLPENRITDDDIRALFAELPETEQQTPPDLLEDLETESLWMLLDIAVTSLGSARAFAAEGLRRILERAWADHRMERDTLASIIEVLSLGTTHEDSPDFLDALHMAAQEALVEVDRFTEGER